MNPSNSDATVLRRCAMISWKKNAILTAIVVLLLWLKTWAVVGDAPDAFYVIDNYVTVYIIFALLDVVMYVYNKRNGDD